MFQSLFHLEVYQLLLTALNFLRKLKHTHTDFKETHLYNYSFLPCLDLFLIRFLGKDVGCSAVITSSLITCSPSYQCRHVQGVIYAWVFFVVVVLNLSFLIEDQEKTRYRNQQISLYSDPFFL